MKYIILFFFVAMGFISACHQTAGSEVPAHHESSGDLPKDSLNAGNLVKSEAPDADSKTKQGYALPRFNEKTTSQSPVNILSDSAFRDTGNAVVLTLPSKITAVENLGHTIQLDFTQGSVTNIKGKTYISKQFHFHTPSEHLIDGMTFPMEMHIVNALKDTSDVTSPQYTVVALLFKMGHENRFIQEFLNKIPSEEGKDTLATGSVHFEDLYKSIPVTERGYYTYNGSLTTSPFTESVDWIVEKYILEASPAQIYAIEKMEGDNARHVQALYARKIYSR